MPACAGMTETPRAVARHSREGGTDLFFTLKSMSSKKEKAHEDDNERT
jgi:hypothetical protein